MSTGMKSAQRLPPRVPRENKGGVAGSVRVEGVGGKDASYFFFKSHYINL